MRRSGPHGRDVVSLRWTAARDRPRPQNVRGVKDCPISGESLPLIVLSHGAGGSYEYLRDTAEALADGG